MPNPSTSTKDAARNHTNIARHVSAILEHPDTPDVLRDHILEALAVMNTEADTEARHIAFIFDTYANRESGVRYGKR